jgi:hypothetical protein
MGQSGSSTVTSSRCSQEFHPPCAGCGAPTFRRSSHNHIFRESGRVHETFCETCFLIAASASLPVLRAAAAAWPEAHGEELLTRLVRRNAMVALEVELPLN